MGKNYQSMSELSEAQKRNVYYYVTNSNRFADLKTRTEEAGFVWNKKGSTSDRDLRASKSGAISLFKSDISKSGYGFKDYSTGFSALNIVDFQVYLDSNGTATNGLKNDKSIREKAVDNLIRDYGLTMNDLLKNIFQNTLKDSVNNLSQIRSKSKRTLKKDEPEKEIKILGDPKTYNEKNKEFKLNQFRIDPQTKEPIYKLNVFSKKIDYDPNDKSQRIGTLKNYTYDAKKMTPKEPAWQYLKNKRRLSDETIDKFKDSLLSVKLWDGKDGIAFLGTNNGKIYTAEIKNLDKDNKRTFKYNKSGDNFAPFEYIKDKSQKIDALFFVEGAIDAMSLDEVLRNKEKINYGIIGIGGTGNLVKAVEDSLKNLDVSLNDITISMDNDRAGMDAVKNYIEHFEHIPNLYYPYNMLDTSSYKEAVRLGIAEIDPNNKNEIKIPKDFNDFLVMGRNIRDLINKGANLSFTSMKKCYVNKNYDSIFDTKDKHFEKVLDNISQKTGLTKETIDSYLTKNNNVPFYKKNILPKMKIEDPKKEQAQAKENKRIDNKTNEQKEKVQDKAVEDKAVKKEKENKDLTSKPEVKEEKSKSSRIKNMKSTEIDSKNYKNRPIKKEKNTPIKKEKNERKNEMTEEKKQEVPRKPLTQEDIREALEKINDKPLFVLNAENYKGEKSHSYVAVSDLLKQDIGYCFKANYKEYETKNSASMILLDKLNTGDFLVQLRKNDEKSRSDNFFHVNLDLYNKKASIDNIKDPKEFNLSDNYKGFFVDDLNILYEDGTLITNNIMSKDCKELNSFSFDKDSISYIRNINNPKEKSVPLYNNEKLNSLKNLNKIYFEEQLGVVKHEEDFSIYTDVKGIKKLNSKDKNYLLNEVTMSNFKGDLKLDKDIQKEINFIEKSLLLHERNKNNIEIQR